MLLKRYYAQLSIVNNKFHYTSRSCDLKFTWTDTLSRSNVSGDIQLELDSILYNIGALHAELGTIGLRTNSESIKIACTHFQCAAWVFKKLKENTHFKSKDLSQDLMAFNYSIMLAQAQECFLEKSILDKRNPSIVAKIAAEVASNYDHLIVILVEAEIQEKESLHNKLFKEWKKFFEFKISFYSAICSYFMGVHEEIKMGERVAWLMNSDEKLKSSIKHAKITGRSSLVESVDYLVNLVTKALEQAKQNNDFVYHDVVPTQDKLTAIKGVSLVKEIGFSVSDAEVMGKDIFGRLVPIEAYQTISIYSDNRDKLWREIKSKIDDKNEELVKFLSIIQLDKDNVRQRKFNVPEKLASICASLNSSSTNFLDEVKERLGKLDDLSKEVDGQFKELEKTILNEEEVEKSNNRSKTSSISSLRTEFDRNYEVHKSAMTSNQGLHDIIKTHEKDIELLMRSSVQELEKLFSMSADDLPMDKDNLAELDKLFDKIEEMKKQRAFLENKLKQSIKNDDILKSVAAHSELEIKAVFEKENQKFDVDLKYLEMNMSAQEQILNALTKANADYAETRKAFIKVEKLRSEKIESLYESYENVQGVLINLDKGIEFYANLKQVIQQLRTKITRHIEERKLLSEKSSAGDLTSSNAIASPVHKTNLSTIQSTNSNIPLNETKGPSKLRDFLPAFYDSQSKPANMPPNLSPANNLPRVIPSSIKNNNLPTNLPINPANNLTNQPPVSNTIANVSNYSSLPPTNLPPANNVGQLSNPTFSTNQNVIPPKPIAYSTANYPTTNVYQPSYSNYNPSTSFTTPINATTNTGYNVANPYANYQSNLLPQSMIPNTSVYQQSTSHVPSINNYQQPTTATYQNGNYYMPAQPQYLPPGTNYQLPTGTTYYPPSNHPSQPQMQTTNIGQPPVPKNNVQTQNLNYGMQNLNLNNGNYAGGQPNNQSYCRLK